MGGPSSEDKAAQRAISAEQVQIGKNQDQRAAELHAASMPGFKVANDYYMKLASGDPTAIARAIAPATEQITAQSDAAKERIANEMPAGGEKRLAMENADIAKASSIGRLATTSYTSAFPALAAMAGQGIGLSANEVANAISAFNGASSANSQVMQADASSKASTMGFMGSMVGAGATMAAAA